MPTRSDTTTFQQQNRLIHGQLGICPCLWCKLQGHRQSGKTEGKSPPVGGLKHFGYASNKEVPSEGARGTKCPRS